ncbi:hypothetical protein L6164_020839 [Bauhinia variegata]|uniref:Uncharacterized protein n=1 Tax=Bauhinia variegata TaxID=167791 RepID=A0ACB9MXM0_BAUVA|nr:hypothetical protein L6164_020839 [Bauhinia variegata]
MDSLSSVSPSMVLPPSNPFQSQSRRIVLLSRVPYRRFPRVTAVTPKPSRRPVKIVSCKLGGGGDVEGADDDGESEEVERALHMDGTIPVTSNEFVKQVSSRAYDMRRHLQQSCDSSSYDVLVAILWRLLLQAACTDHTLFFNVYFVPFLDANPWRGSSKPVYVLTQKENQLCTMKTRRNRSEVERELGLLFSKGANRRSGIGNQSKQARRTKFPMLVEDVREGVLVFEDENEAVKYCDLLQGGDQVCEGVAEIEASSIFDLCQRMRALAVLFRRGRTPPQPENLKLNLRARKRSLEDHDDLI